MHARWTTCSR